MSKPRFSIADFAAPAVSDLDTEEVTLIPWTKLVENPRNFYNTSDVADLADSIQVNGLLDPLVVYPIPGSESGSYRLLSGHRRLRAIKHLVAERREPERWTKIPCRVLPAPESEAREDLMLIHANSTGRVRTPGELSTEAERLTAALVALKEQGVELPGRLRGVVAAAIGVSQSKLARLKVIRDKLMVPGFKAAFEKGKLPEAVAYDVARMEQAAQYKLLDRVVDAGLTFDKLDMRTASRLKKQVEKGESTNQELAVFCEKRGLAIRDGDYSPLFAELVAAAVPRDFQEGLSSCPTKATGVFHLRRVGVMHYSVHGGPVSYSADPSGLLIERPICRRFSWAEVWELLALASLQQPEAAPTDVSDSDRAQPEAPAAETQQPALPERWRRCDVYDPADGQSVILLTEGVDGGYWTAHPAIYREERDAYEDLSGFALAAGGCDLTVGGEAYWIPAPEKLPAPPPARG